MLERDLYKMEKKLQEKEAKIERLKNNFVADKEDEWLKEKKMHEEKLHAAFVIPKQRKGTKSLQSWSL